MAEQTMDKLVVSSEYEALAKEALEKREKLLAQRRKASAEMPLRFWNQQAHFTTPASGTPGKAIQGLAAVAKILNRFEIAPEEIAERSGADLSVLKSILESDNKHSPFVMVDVEDAVAHTPEAIAKGRAGAVHTFTQDEWGPTLPFYRPAGLLLDTCVEDILTVLPECAKGREPQDFPVAGIVWPKSEHPEEIEWVCEILAKLEKQLGLEENQIKLEFLVESGFALNQLAQLAKNAAHRLVGIIWGIADYSADANLPRIENAHPVCDWARYEIVNIAGGVGVPAIDNMTLNYPTPVHRGGDLTDEQKAENKDKILGALKEAYDDAVHGIELGMSGKWVGHPAQLLMVLAAYRNAIPEKQIQKDLKEIDAYTQSVQAGAGATMIGEGRNAYMADRATDRHVRARLRRATAWGTVPVDKALELGLISADEAKTLSA